MQSEMSICGSIIIGVSAIFDCRIHLNLKTAFRILLIVSATEKKKRTRVPKSELR